MNLVKENIDSLLIALVLCVNVLRFFMGVNDTPLSLYAIYVLLIIILFVKYSSSIKRTLYSDRGIRICYLLMVSILLYGFISLTWMQSTKVIQSYAKFIVALAIPALCLALPMKKIQKIIDFVIIINIAYCLVILLQPYRVVHYQMSANVNYLTLTLTIGLCLTMTISRMIFSFNSDNYKKSAFWFGLSAFFFTVLTRFAARGVLIFPALIAIILCFFNERKKIGKSIFLILFLVSLGYMALTYFLEHGGAYSTARFLRLFEETEDEDRISIWKRALEDILNNNWYVFGGGIEAFKYNSSIKFYPHNIFIQMLGEYGLWGLMVLLGTMSLVIRRSVNVIRSRCNVANNEALFCVFSGALYYIFTFNKSFSMYDSCPMFIMMILCLALCRRTTIQTLKTGKIEL